MPADAIFGTCAGGVVIGKRDLQLFRIVLLRSRDLP